MTKVCFKCGHEKGLNEFYAHKMMADGHLNKCKDCTKLYVNERYAKDFDKIAEYERRRFQTAHRKQKALQYQTTGRERDPEKHRARTALGNAIRDGKVTRLPCRICGAKAQGHHHDYSKPLDVDWLCFRCHRTEHGQRHFTQGE